MKCSRYRLAGYLLIGMLLFSVLDRLFPTVPIILTGICGWIALGLLLKDLGKQHLIQNFILTMTGIVCLLWAWKRGAIPDLGQILSQNQLLLSMLVGVSFLRLITLPATEKGDVSPTGKNAFIRTLIGTHFFSAVINLSAIMIVAERLNFREKPDRELSILLTRSFGAAAFWSPFFAAMATALTYSPGASIGKLLIMGIPLAIAGLMITIISLSADQKNHLEKFEGYPIHYSSLWVPALLAIFVLFFHYYFPQISILVVITSLSIVMSLITLAVTTPKTALVSIDHHISRALPAMVNELALFLSAGVLAVGLRNLSLSFDQILVIENFGVLQMASLLIVMVTLALIGVHPVISIAIAGIWLKSMQIDPNLLGLVFIFAWGIGISVSPLSGLNMALHGCFGIRGTEIMKWNAGYTVQMLVVSTLLFWIYQSINYF